MGVLAGRGMADLPLSGYGSRVVAQDRVTWLTQRRVEAFQAVVGVSAFAVVVTGYVLGAWTQARHTALILLLGASCNCLQLVVWWRRAQRRRQS